MWCQCGNHLMSMWKQCSVHLETTWCPHGNHVVSTYCPCRYQFSTNFHHFHVTSVDNRSWKMTKLWKPVTSLIMVWFSICKMFWKAHGLLYHFVVSFSCHFPSFSCHFPRGKQWCCFPFSQIALLSHVTTLYWPIRGLALLKSPTNNQNFGKIVRFHWKFFPHLKSKAVRTALLKIKEYSLN